MPPTTYRSERRPPGIASLAEAVGPTPAARAEDVRTAERPALVRSAEEANVSEVPPEPWKGQIPDGQSADVKAIESFLQLLARAIRQFHTYPPTSPLCREAVEACHRRLASLGDADELAFRVTPRELRAGETVLGGGTIVEQELARRLHRAHVAILAVDPAASPRELSRFCNDLVQYNELRAPDLTLADLLAEHGVASITLHMAHRFEVLDVGAPPQPLCELVEGERRRRGRLATTGAPAYHFYPPDKGWVRLDPTSAFETVSLVDLAILVDDPAVLARMLIRLTDGEFRGTVGGDAALQQKFTDVATVFAAMDPRLARVMFAKLARAVLNLDAERRTELLRRTILPDLLDGRADGAVLKEFPDLELADSLCLLLDLETAAPEVLATALERLDLPAERQAALVPLVESRLRNDPRTDRLSDPAGTEVPPDAATGSVGVERHARRLIRIDHTDHKSFAEFAAFDLALDEQATLALGRLRDGIGATDPIEAQLQCLWSLVRLEPNPGLAERFLDRASALLGALERAGRWGDVASWVSRHRQLAETLREPRPDVADVISAKLAAFCTPDRMIGLGGIHATGADGRAAAGAMVEAFGAAIAPALVAALGDRAPDPAARALVRLMCDHASLLAPALVDCVGHPEVAVGRAVLRVLGFAGTGFETAIAGQLGSPDEPTAREAFRALARIGTPRAAALVAAAIGHVSDRVRAAAEETLLRFPKADVERQLRLLLGRRDFVLRYPQTAGRLLDRAAQADAAGIEQALRSLAPLRFRFWNPSLVRVGLKARALLAQR